MPTTTSRFPTDRPWWNAVASLNLKAVRSMLDEGVSPNLRESPLNDSALDKLVHTSIARRPGAANLIALLIKAGADPFVPSQGGRSSAFETAMGQNDGEVLARAMVLNVDWSPWAMRARASKALLLAVRFHPQLVMPMLDRGAPLDGDGKTSVLGEALARGPVDLVKALLARGATLSEEQIAQDEDMVALVARGGARTAETVDELNQRRRDLVNLLHARGHRLTTTARARVIGMAVKNRCDLPFLHRLVELGADPCGTTAQGLNALHIAVSSPGGYPYVDLLLAMGVDPTVPSLAGQTPLQRLMHMASNQAKARPVLARMEAFVLQGALHDPSLSMGPDAAPPRRRL